MSSAVDLGVGSKFETLILWCDGGATERHIILAGSGGFVESPESFWDFYGGRKRRRGRLKFSIWDVGVEYPKRKTTCSSYYLDEVLKEFDAFIPPAKGEKGDGCGEKTLEFVCPNPKCDYARRELAYCKKATCPKCGTSWIKKATARITAKLETLRRYKQSFTRKHIRLHHLVLSPPMWEEIKVKERNPKAFADALFRKAVKILKRCGIKDFVIIFHPYRLADAEIWDLEAEERAWKNALKSDDWRDKVKIYPHFHVFVAEHFIKGGKDVYDEYGWVLKRVTGRFERVSIYDSEDLAKQVYYCLSHAGLLENCGFRAYRYYGRIKNLKIKDEVKKDAVGCAHVAEARIGIYESPECDFYTVFYPWLALICPKCGSKLIPKPPPEQDKHNYLGGRG